MAHLETITDSCFPVMESAPQTVLPQNGVCWLTWPGDPAGALTLGVIWWSSRPGPLSISWLSPLYDFSILKLFMMSRGLPSPWLTSFLLQTQRERESCSLLSSSLWPESGPMSITNNYCSQECHARPEPHSLIPEAKGEVNITSSETY